MSLRIIAPGPFCLDVAGFTMNVFYRFQFTAEHLVQGFRRFRSQTRTRFFRYAFIGFAVPLFVALTLISAFTGDWLLALGCAVFVVFFASSSRIDDFVIRRKFRKSPFRDEHLEFTLSDAAVLVSGPKQRSELSWDVFTAAKLFADGVLLLQGPGVFIWLPHSALDSKSSLDAAEAMIERKIAATSRA